MSKIHPSIIKPHSTASVRPVLPCDKYLRNQGKDTYKIERYTETGAQDIDCYQLCNVPIANRSEENKKQLEECSNSIVTTSGGKYKSKKRSKRKSTRKQQVVQKKCNTRKKSQKWNYKNKKWISLKNKQCLDVIGGHYDNGSMIVYPCHKGSNQKFK